MITLSGLLLEIKYGRAYIDVAGRIVGLPLTPEQQRELGASVGKTLVLTVAEVKSLTNAPMMPEVGT